MHQSHSILSTNHFYSPTTNFLQNPSGSYKNHQKSTMAKFSATILAVAVIAVYVSVVSIPIIYYLKNNISILNFFQEYVLKNSKLFINWFVFNIIFCRRSWPKQHHPNHLEVCVNTEANVMLMHVSLHHPFVVMVTVLLLLQKWLLLPRENALVVQRDVLLSLLMDRALQTTLLLTLMPIIKVVLNKMWKNEEALPTKFTIYLFKFWNNQSDYLSHVFFLQKFV